MPQQNNRVDYDQLRERLEDMEEPLDEHAIEEILYAVFEAFESEFAAEWRDPTFKVQSEHDKKVYDAAQRLEKATHDLLLLLDESKTGRVLHSIATLQDELQKLLPTLIPKLREVSKQVRDYKKRGRKEDAETILVKQVAQAIRRFGYERQEYDREYQDELRGRGRHKYVGDGLRKDEHLAFVIREVLHAIDVPTDKYDDETLLRYAREQK